MDDHVACTRLDGSTIMVPRSAIAFRPGAYALITRGDRLLTVRLHNGKYFLPGGGVEPGEPLVEAVRREVREETGLEAVVGRLFTFVENFYYFDPTREAWHGLSFVYVCGLADPDAAIPPGAGDEDEGYPEWVELASLHDGNLHGIAATAVRRFAESLAAARDPRR